MRTGWRHLLAALAVAALLATGVTLPVAAVRHPVSFSLEVRLAVDHDSRAQVFFDLGDGFRESDSVVRNVPADGKSHGVRFPLPAGTVRGLRIDPDSGPGRLLLRPVRIASSSGRTVARLSSADVAPINEISTVETERDGFRITTTPSAADPQLELRLSHPVELRPGIEDIVRPLVPLWAGVFAGSLVLAWLIRRARPRAGLAPAWLRRHPVLTLAAAATLGVCVQCHPVLFFGKSFVSPDNAVFLLYDHFPTLPGYRSDGLEDGKGTDVAALLHESIHYPGLQRDALFVDHELPLWNRYVMAGAPLLGQGQSMFGGLLNLIPLAGRSSALSWDIRFLVTRWLYAFGIGLTVWLLARDLAAGVISGISGLFIGYFAYRLNHMAQFSLGVAPWVVVAWVLLRDARTARRAAWSLVLLVSSGWELIHSGTVKEAYMLLLLSNLAGLALVLSSGGPCKPRLLRVAAAAGAGFVLILLSSPTWWVFVDTLGESVTHYDHASIRQAAPWQVLGFFEDLFVRQLQPNENHVLPSANLIVLLGISWSVVGLRQTWRSGTAALLLVSLLPLALAFGWLPAGLIERVPMAATIQHFDNTFGCALVPLATILGGFGISGYLRGAAQLGFSRSAAWIFLLPAALVLLFMAGAHGWVGKPFFNSYAVSLAVGFILLALAPALWTRFRDPGLVVVVAAGAGMLLLWRHGQYLHTAFDEYVVNPRVRAQWEVKSPAVEQIRSLSGEPNRIVGLSYNLFASYATTLRLETIYGVEPLRNPYFNDLTFKGGIVKMNWGDPRNWHEDHIRYLLPLQNAMNVRYYLAGHDQSPGSLEGLVPRGRFDLDVWESPGAWPRAFFTAERTVCDTVESLLQELERGFPRKPFAALTSEDNARLGSSAGESEAGLYVPARAYRMTTNTSSFVVDAPRPGIAVLTEAYDRDLTATVNGKPTRVLRVNYAFRGVELPGPGTFRVQFTYWPRRLSLALCLSAGGALLALLGFALVHLGWIPIVGHHDDSRSSTRPAS